MKKIIIALGLAAIVVTVLVANGAAGTQGTLPVCYGVIRDVDMVNHPGCSGVLCTIVENGWNVTSDANGNFGIAPVNDVYPPINGGYPPTGTYHLMLTKYGKGPVTIEFYYHNGGPRYPYSLNLGVILF
jgi:hypothetical protein